MIGLALRREYRARELDGDESCDSSDVAHVDEDGELVRRVAEGDADALRELYGMHGKLVFGMAYRVLGDRQLAEDCTQDVFVALWRGARTYDPERARVTTWLFTVTRNTAIDIVRRRETRRADPLPEDEAAWAMGTEPDAAALTASAETAERVAAALAELPRPQLEAVSLAYFDGLSHAEIAARLDVPLGTVKGRIRLGLDRLRELAPTYALESEAER